MGCSSAANYILAKVSQHLADSQRKDAQHSDEERLCTKTCPLNRNQLPFDQGVQIVISQRAPASVPETIIALSGGILH